MTESSPNDLQPARTGALLTVAVWCAALAAVLLFVAGMVFVAPLAFRAHGGPRSGRGSFSGAPRRDAVPAVPFGGSLSPSPVSSATAEYAEPYPGALPVRPVEIVKLHPRHGLVALTFDDGFNPDMRILALLEHYHIRCTTFLIGEVVEHNPELVRRMQADGFEIGNHTWNHMRLPPLPDAAIRLELAHAQRYISGITGNQAPYMRPPHGLTSPRVEAVAASMGYRTVLLDRSLGDTRRNTTVDEAVYRAVSGLQPGDVIAAHWDGYVTYEALLRIIPHVLRRGYRFVTISDLVKDSGGPATLH